MQMLTTEAAQAEIINEDFTSPETVLPLPSFGRNLQRLPQQAFWRWSIQNLPWEQENLSPNVDLPARMVEARRPVAGRNRKRTCGLRNMNIQ